MNGENYSNKNKCLRDYDGKCSGKPSWQITEVSTSGVWTMYFCDFHKKQLSKEVPTLTWTKLK